jgi:hypothetical protein
MIVIAEPRQEEDILAPAYLEADEDMLLEDVRDWACDCVVHLCGCNCKC